MLAPYYHYNCAHYLGGPNDAPFVLDDNARSNYLGRSVQGYFVAHLRRRRPVHALLLPDVVDYEDIELPVETRIRYDPQLGFAGPEEKVRTLPHDLATRSRHRRAEKQMIQPPCQRAFVLPPVVTRTEMSCLPYGLGSRRRLATFEGFEPSLRNLSNSPRLARQVLLGSTPSSLPFSASLLQSLRVC